MKYVLFFHILYFVCCVLHIVPHIVSQIQLHDPGLEKDLEKVHHYITYKPSNWFISCSYIHDSFSIWEWSVIDQSDVCSLYFSQSINLLILKVFFQHFPPFISRCQLSLIESDYSIYFDFGLFLKSYRHCPVKALFLMIAWWLHQHDVTSSSVWWIHNKNLRLVIFPANVFSS